MQCEVISYKDMWLEIKQAALNTINKNTNQYPDLVWKQKIIMAQHSPIRIGRFIVKLYDIPSFVAGHLVRHKHGVEWFVSSRRDDRYDGEISDRNMPVDVIADLNFQAILNISRKRLCNCAHKETIKVWRMVLDKIKEYELELYNCCIQECIICGFCPEFKSCGFYKSNDFELKRSSYIDLVKERE